jgi:addiction module HigA family antidote
VEEFLKPMEITQRELADVIHVPYQRVNGLVDKKRGVTPSTALRLSRFIGVSADFWFALQIRWDLYKVKQQEEQQEEQELEEILDYHHLHRPAV